MNIKLLSYISFFFLLISNALFSQDKALYFNGINTRIQSLDVIGDYGSNKTLCFWFKSIDKSTTRRYIYNMCNKYNRNDTDNGRFDGLNNLGIYSNGSLYMNANPNIDVSEWHHFTVTNDRLNNKRSLYIDGIKIKDVNSTDYRELNVEELNIGVYRYDWGYYNFFKGLIKDVRLYNRVLTDSEISDTFLKRINGNEDGLVLYWPLNEGNGGIAYDNINHNNGTIYNPSWITDYPPYYGNLKLNKGLGVDSVGVFGAKALIDITYGETGFPNGLMMYQYGNKDSALVTQNENFPADISTRSDIFWHFSERGMIAADITFDYSQIKGIKYPELVKILVRDSISDPNWKVLNESERDNTNKTISLTNVTEFKQYAIGYTLDTNFIYLSKPFNNSKNIDTTNIKLCWFTDSLSNFKVYIDENQIPTTLYKENISENYIYVDTLNTGRKYYWRVEGFDKNGLKYTSPIFSFYTNEISVFLQKNMPSISNLKIHYNDINSEYLIEEHSILPNHDALHTFGNTGFKYNKNTHELWVSRYHFNVTEVVVVKDRNNRYIKQFNVKPYVNYIQGLAINSKDSSFWVAGSRPGWTSTSPLTSHLIAHFDKNGNYLDEIAMPNVYFGMLDYVENKNALWVKESDKSMAYLISLSSNDTIQSIDLGMHGEGIAVSPFDSTFWLHDSYNVAQVSKYGHRLNTFPSPVVLNPNAEDITVDPTDYTVWVGADEYLHGRINGGNKVWHLDPFHTYNKDVFFPNMIHWCEGIVSENLLLERDTLYVKLGQKKGTWTSPVINFEEYNPKMPEVTNSNEDYSYFKFWFRGSDTPPTADLIDIHALDYYKLTNTENEGWGSTMPSEWTDTVPDFKYLQVKMELSLFNFPPNAFPDTFTVVEENTIEIRAKDILRNDFDRDNYPDTLGIGQFTQPQNGTISMNSLAVLSYTPNENFYGEDYFNYCNFDGRDSSNYEKVIINVINVNDKPKITGQNYFSINEDELSEFNFNSLVVSDSDNEYPGDFSYTLFPGKNYEIIENKILPKENYNGYITVPIQINDGSPKNNLSNVFNLKVFVQNINDEPKITAQKEITIPEDSLYKFSLNDIFVSDIDNTFPSDFSFSIFEGENYSVSENQIIPKTNYFGELSVPVVVYDGENLNNESNTFFLKINVRPVNDKPGIISQSDISINEDESYTLSINDIVVSDVDDTDFTIAVAEGMNYSLTGNTVTPDENFFGTLFIPVKANDNGTENNFSESYILEIQVLPVNDKPLISLPEQITFQEDTYSAMYNFSNYISDVDNNLAELSILFEPTQNIDVDKSGNNFVFFSKNKNWFGSEEIVFYVSDGEYTVYDTVLLVCEPVNDLPEILSTANFNKIKNEKLLITINDIEFTDVDNSSSFSINLYEGENYTINNDTVIPAKDFTGTVEVPVSISDKNGESELSFIYIIYYAKSVAPVFNLPPKVTLQEDTIRLIDFSRYIADENVAGIDLRLSISENEYITFQQSKQQILFTPVPNWYGETEVILSVFNGILTTVDTLTVLCTPINDSPEFKDKNNFYFLEDSGIKIAASDLVVDIDNDISDLEITLSEAPNLKYSYINDSIYISNLHENWFGNDTIELSVKNQEFTINQKLYISCKPVNDTPQLNLPDTIYFNEDESILIDFTEYITDIDNPISDLSLNWNNNFYINAERVARFKLKFSSNKSNWNGLEELSFTINDGLAGTSDTIIVACLPVNDLPEIIVNEKITCVEDSEISIHNKEIAKDTDNTIDELSFYITENQNIRYRFSNDSLYLSPLPNWNGSENIKLIVTDNETSVEKTLQIDVLPENDAPEFKGNIEFSFNEDDSVSIDMEKWISDIDNSTSELGLSVDSVGTTISWQINKKILKLKSNTKDWNGFSYIYLKLTDGDKQVSKKLNINCIAVNDPPIVYFPDTLTFYEDNDFKIDFSEYIYDVDNKKSSFILNWENSNNFKIKNNELTVSILNEPKNWIGENDIIFTVSDNSGGKTSQSVKVIVLPINDAPNLETYYPEDKIITVFQDTTLTFEANASDVDSELSYNWYFNSELVNNTNYFEQYFDSVGNYSVKVIITDNEYKLISNWHISVLNNPVIEIKNKEYFSLLQNIPNPFSELTKIGFYLETDDHTNLSIYNSSGRIIKTLVNKELKSGFHVYYWNGYDSNNQELPSGIYIYKLQTSMKIKMKKAVYINSTQ